jgi:hypothetical protein
MPDPLTAAAAASGPAAVSAGASAMALAAFGVDAQALAVGLTGAVLGLTFTPPAHPIHGAARFVASAVFSAVVGTAAGQQWTMSRLTTNAAICVTGALLHLGLAWVGKRFGQIADAGARRAGIDIDGSQP